MKVSVLALLATAALTTARVVPPCGHRVTDAADHDITTVTTTQHMACTRTCTKYKPKCGYGTYPVEDLFRKCWVCCWNRGKGQEFEPVEEFDELD